MGDFMAKYVVAIFTAKEEDKPAIEAKIFGEGLPALLALLEKEIPENGWFHGNKLSANDFIVGGFFTNTALNEKSNLYKPAKAVIDSVAGPKTLAYIARFQEEFKNYLANRPVSSG